MLSKQAAQKAIMMRSATNRTSAVVAQKFAMPSVMASTQSKDYHCVMSQNKSSKNSQMRWFSTSENKEASSTETKEAAASSSDSDEELDIDLGDESLDMQQSVQFDKMGAQKTNSNFNMYRFDSPKDAFKSMKQFNDEFAQSVTKKQFMIYLANISRSVAQHSNEASQYQEDFNQLNKHVVTRMGQELNERDWPILGNYCNSIYKIRADQGANLQREYLSTLKELFKRDEDGKLNEIAQQLDFDMLVQMYQPVSVSQFIPEAMMNQMADLIQDPTARKSTSRLVQLMNKIEKKPQFTKSYNRTLQSLIEHFNNQQELQFIDADLKVRILRSIAHISKQRAIPAQFMISLIQDIKENLNQLQESNVIDLLNVAESVYKGMNVNHRVLKELEQLLNELNALVVEMAIENPDLVNFNFLINFIENNRKLPQQLLSKDQQDRMLSMVEAKITADEHQVLKNNTPQKKRFIMFGFFNRNQSEVLSKAAVDLYVEPNQYRDYWNTYMAIRIANNFKDQETRDEYLKKINDTLKEASIYKQNLAAEVFLALDGQPNTDQEALDHLRGQFDLEKIKYKEMSGLLQIYLLNKNVHNSESSQALIKEISEQLFKGQKDGFRNSLETRFELELANKLSIHHHEQCVFKREYADQIKDLSYIQDGQKAPVHAVINFIQIAKRVMQEGTTLNYSIIRNQQHKTNRNFQTYVLDRIYEMHDFEAPYNSKHIAYQIFDFIKSSIKTREPEGTHKGVNQLKFETAALRVLDEFKGQECGAIDGFTNEIQFIQRNFKRIPKGYKEKVQDVLAKFRFDDDEIPQSIVHLITIAGMDQIGEEGQRNLYQFMTEQQDVDKMIESTQNVGLIQAMARLEFLEYMQKLDLKDDNGDEIKFVLTKQQKIDLSNNIIDKLESHLNENSSRQDQVATWLKSLVVCDSLFPSEVRTKSRKVIDLAMSKTSPSQVINMLTKSDKNSLIPQNIIAKIVLSSFSSVHGESFLKLEPQQMNNLMDKYQRVESRDIDAYNNFISSFGENFHQYSESELIRFTQQLVNIGMSQDDIFEAVIERIEELFNENKEKPEEEKRPFHYRFNKTNHRLFCQCLDLGLEDKEFFQSVISDESIQKIYGEGNTFSSLTLSENSTQQCLVALTSIIASKLDEKKPEYSDLAEQLYNKITEDKESKFSNQQKRDLGTIAKIMGKPEPHDLNLKQTERYASYLSQLLAKMGNTVTQSEGAFSVDSYLPDLNKCVIFLNDKNTLFDNKTPDRRFKMYLRALEQKSNPPMESVLVNQNDFRKIKSEEHQMEFLKKMGLPMATEPQADNQENTQ